jgi:trimethylamine--corrinoid protein Co-methyltransferase
LAVTCQILTEDEKQIIHHESLRILWEVGVLFRSQKAVEILTSNGARFDGETKLVHIQPEMVEEALSTSPKAFGLGALSPDRSVSLPTRESGYVLDNGGLYTRDLQTGERRFATYQDHLDFVQVFDRMEHAAIVWPTSVHDFQPASATVKTAISTFMYSSLHVQDELSNPYEVPLIVAALEAILGSADAVKASKIYSVVYCTIAPLSHEENMCEAYLELLPYEVPICIFPMPCAGSTGPASLFSNVAMSNAEALSALVLFQMASPGTPLIFGDASGITDLHTGSFLEGSPEMVLQTAARGEMARFYGLPNEQAGCLTDATQPGPQAVLEKVLTTLPLVLGGADLIQGPGALETSNLMSLEQIVVDEEIAALCQRLRRGVDVSPGKNYFEDIKAVGPGENFLGRPNTRAASRGIEFLTPGLGERSLYKDWLELGRPDMYAQAKGRVEQILAAPLESTLPGEIIGKLEDIMRKAEDQLK